MVDLKRSITTGVLVLTCALPAAGQEVDFRTPTQTVEEQFLFLRKGIQAEYFSREVGQDWDQMVFWPHGAAQPTHLVGCVEEILGCLSGACGESFVVGDKLTPSVQLIDLQTRAVTTLVRGMTICDGIRTTPWGTLVATEEDLVSDTGAVYEILDPLTKDEFTILERGSGGAPARIVDQAGRDASASIIKRTAFPVIRYEGFLVHETGVVIAGDEERPGSYAQGDTDGGAVYKFIPTRLYDPNTGPIASLDQSPLVEGTIYALQVSCRDDLQQFGQGCEVGNGTWIPLTPTAASEPTAAPESGITLTRFFPDKGKLRIGREAANAAGATAYYRPEDLHRDPLFSDPTQPEAIRFCFAVTGNHTASNYGEVQCAIDRNVTAATGTTGEIVLNRFIEGSPEFSQPDNLAFQPTTGALFVVEDNGTSQGNSDVWACLPDGADADIKSDGCVRLLKIADGSAESTGFLFTPDGTQAYFAIQHSADGNMPLVDDFRTDDLIRLSGFRVRPMKYDFGARTAHRLERQSYRYFGFGAENRIE